MEPLFELGLNVTRWLQESYPSLNSFFQIFTQMGRFEFFLAFLPIIYWAVNKRLGQHLIYLLACGDLLSAITKHGFRGPRPFWIDSSVGLSTEASYGVPSGHAISTTLTYLTLAIWVRRGWMWLLALGMIGVMGLSRIYLGAHFVHDVVAGTLLAILIIIIYLIWRRYGTEFFRQRILGQRLLVVISLPVVLVIIYLIVLLIIGQPDQTVAWATFAGTSETVSIASIATAFGILLGLGVGILFEGSRVRFRVDGSLWQKVGRYLLGMVGILLIWRGLGAIFPDEPLWLGVPLRILRYFLLGMWATYYAPMLFVRLKLAPADPERGIELKLRPELDELHK